MSHNLNSLKGDMLREYIGDYYREEIRLAHIDIGVTIRIHSLLANQRSGEGFADSARGSAQGRGMPLNLHGRPCK